MKTVSRYYTHRTIFFIRRELVDMVKLSPFYNKFITHYYTAAKRKIIFFYAHVFPLNVPPY